jgi:hypothetical protein
MGQLSAPIMTPLGVVYRSLCNNQGEALKYAEWAVKLFGGTASAFYVIGPGPKGFYEAAILGNVPTNAKQIKPPAKERPEWQDAPAQAYVLFDDTETPLALYFHEHNLLLKPKESPPLTAGCDIDLRQ